VKIKNIMSLKITLRENKIKSNKSYKKWFARPVHIGEVHTADIAKKIQTNSTFSQGTVKGVIDDFLQEMKQSMESGQTVVIDGLGRFELTIESEGVDDPKDFRIARDIKKVKCKFLQAGKRKMDGTLSLQLSKDADVDWAPGVWE